MSRGPQDAAEARSYIEYFEENEAAWRARLADLEARKVPRLAAEFRESFDKAVANYEASKAFLADHAEPEPQTALQALYEQGGPFEIDDIIDAYRTDNGLDEQSSPGVSATVPTEESEAPEQTQPVEPKRAEGKHRLSDADIAEMAAVGRTYVLANGGSAEPDNVEYHVREQTGKLVPTSGRSRQKFIRYAGFVTRDDPTRTGHSYRWAIPDQMESSSDDQRYEMESSSVNEPHEMESSSPDGKLLVDQMESSSPPLVVDGKLLIVEMESSSIIAATNGKLLTPHGAQMESSSGPTGSAFHLSG